MMQTSDRGCGHDSTDVAALKHLAMELSAKRIARATDFSQDDCLK